jgi:hypothetical protein
VRGLLSLEVADLSIGSVVVVVGLLRAVPAPVGGRNVEELAGKVEDRAGFVVAEFEVVSDEDVVVVVARAGDDVDGAAIKTEDMVVGDVFPELAAAVLMLK